MERSRTRTLLGLALIVFGALALAHALTRPVILAPAMPDMPQMPAMPDMPPLPDMPRMPDMPQMPAMPDLPPLPELPPPAPQPPQAGSWMHWGWLNPATILLLVLLLLVWRRGRATRERPLA